MRAGAEAVTVGDCIPLCWYCCRVVRVFDSTARSGLDLAKWRPVVLWRFIFDLGLVSQILTERSSIFWRRISTRSELEITGY